MQLQPSLLPITLTPFLLLQLTFLPIVHPPPCSQLLQKQRLNSHPNRLIAFTP
jgi:hypothetical protein